MDYTNIPTGLKITSQIPLDVKKYVKDESTLAYLGIDDNLAFTYHDQLEVLCLQEKNKYIWREVLPGEENTGLIPLDFTYPLNLPETYGINYSGKTYNFFKIDLTGPQGEPGPQGIQGIQGPTGPQGPAGENGQDGTTIVENGISTQVTGNGTELDPYNVNVINLQKEISTNYTLQASDHLHTIFLTPTTEMIITIPETELPNNFVVGFYHVSSPGEYNIVFEVENSLTQELRVPTGFIPIMNTSGNFSCMIERRLSTQEYMLNGDLKSGII